MSPRFRSLQKIFKWERVLSIPSCPQISPFHLLHLYVGLTRFQGKVGGPVLLSLKAPFKPISADTVGSITKKILESVGVSSAWGPHSRSGAGASLMKKLGLTSEEVCEIGKWKDVSALTAHYQRLGAQDKLEEN